MGKAEHYEQAFVPEYLTKLTIEKLPLDEAFYISPGERDDYDSPAIFVSPDRRLKMDRNYAIDIDDDSPTTPLGLVGVMRVAIMNPVTFTIREHFIADLRFMEYHTLVDTDEMAGSLVDQESYMAYVNALDESVEFSAFVALDEDYEFDETKKIPKGNFYGSPNLYPHLATLRKQSNKFMKKFLRQQAIPAPGGAQSDPKQEASKPEQPAKPAQDLSVKFTNDLS